MHSQYKNAHLLILAKFREATLRINESFRSKLKSRNLWIISLLYPLIPVLVAMLYAFFCVVSVSKENKALEELQSQMTFAMMQKAKYDEHKKLYPCSYSFDWDNFFSNRSFGQNLLENKPVHLQGSWSALVDEFRTQKIHFSLQDTKVIRPYKYLHYKMDHPAKLSKDDIRWFIQKLEGDESFHGCKRGFFSRFVLSKKDSILGEYFVVEADIVEKKGSL